VTENPRSLDPLVADIIRRCGYRFVVASSDAERDIAYRLRYEAVVANGWTLATELPDGRERDEYDDAAIHILCHDDDTPIATGRIVLPPARLPTEKTCGIVVEPRGRVADVGRMAVAKTHQSHRHSVFMALLARLYIEVQARGYDVACGLVAAPARSLMRLLGLRLEVLGDERPYGGELRAPVRFPIVPAAARRAEEASDAGARPNTTADPTQS
jgi:N-acyl-L-homoserine lactone synthetase